jgi:N-acyl-D-amino-acid deacylase
VANAASTDEVAEVAKPLGKWGGVYTAHMRDEGENILPAMDETFEIGRRAGASIIVSHHKCSGRTNFGRMKETLPKFTEAMKQQQIAFDVYPYIAGSTILRSDMLDRAEKVLITWSDKVAGLAGRDLKEVAQEMGCSMREAADRIQPAGAIYFMMDEKDVQSAMAHPGAMIGSDGIPFDAHPHPRLWGTFPRVLGHYSRELEALPAGGRGAAHDVVFGAALRAGQAWRGEARLLCRHLRVRSGDGDRHRDLREADLGGQGHRCGAVQRRDRLARRQARRRPLRPRIEAAGSAG